MGNESRGSTVGGLLLSIHYLRNIPLFTFLTPLQTFAIFVDSRRFYTTLYSQLPNHRFSSRSIDPGFALFSIIYFISFTILHFICALLVCIAFRPPLLTELAPTIEWHTRFSLSVTTTVVTFHTVLHQHGARACAFTLQNVI
uniref:Uncharacterized protein n=1 Tax=Anopheles funestus TaxID=62324 RepID=A0A182S217_ANOFN